MSEAKKQEYRTKPGEQIWQIQNGASRKYWELVDVWSNENRVGHIFDRRDLLNEPRPPTRNVEDLAIDAMSIYTLKIAKK